MSGLLYLIPVAIGLGVIGLAAFLWSLKSAQFEDLDGAANRILFDDDAPERRNAEAIRPKRPNRPPTDPMSPAETGRRYLVFSIMPYCSSTAFRSRR